ncbi:MAG: cupin domain-containing protein [Ginsengibacter sp.]
MKNIKEYIDSGILELYVMGDTTPAESKEVEELAIASEQVRNAIDAIRVTLESYAVTHAITPNATIKPFLMATIDYAERIKNGEQPEYPPLLNSSATIEDYARWISRPGMVLPKEFKDFHAKIIGYTQGILTAIVWIKVMAFHEVHDDELEKFLILEGTCDIAIEDEVHHLIAGDYLSIPLHKSHEVRVTSAIPCKIILQRIAA